MDADGELEKLMQALAAFRLEAEGQAPRPPAPPAGDADGDELPLIRRARGEPPPPPGPVVPPPSPEPMVPPASPAWPSWLVPSGRQALVAAAVLLVAGSIAFVGITASVPPPAGDAAPRVPVELVNWDRSSSPRPAVLRVSSTLPSDGKRPRRTMGDVEIELMEQELRRAIRRDGLVIPELDSEPPPEGGEGPRSRMVRFAKTRSGGR